MKKLLILFFCVVCLDSSHAAPPVIDSVLQISHYRLDVHFSEPVSLASSQIPGNYSVNNGIGYAASATRDSADFSLVHVTLKKYFVNGIQYALTAAGIQDLSGNMNPSDTKTFLFFLPGAFDVIINEIMADPSPAVSLPEYEYVELFNRTHFDLPLKNWTLKYGAYTKTFPYCILPADGFLVLCLDSALSAFQPYGPALGIFTSSSSLSNAGTTLILRDHTGATVSTVSYNDTWYQSPIKNSGGWSLEQIDPTSPCGRKSNWKASLDPDGGTPGERNSVNALSPDVKPPSISYVSIISPSCIRLVFSEYMDSATLSPVWNYFIDHGIGNPVSAVSAAPDFTNVSLTLSSPIQPNTIYTVTAKNMIDCAGNAIAPGSAMQFAIPLHPAANDVVINEILFQPKENGTEWVEIYNRSNKVIDLKEIYLCNSDAPGSSSNIKQIAPDGRLILPGEYAVLSKDQDLVKTQYITMNPQGFVDLASFITMKDDSAYMTLADASQTIIDQVQYHAEWHVPLLNDTKGISLERVSYDHPSQDPSNWHSAAESAGGATPAHKNSQYTEGEAGTDLSVAPEIFSPDNDGYNDVLSISYTFDLPGMIGNMRIYDDRGRLVKNLVRNELLAVSGTFFWDGITDERMKARIGIYIIYFEAFSTTGEIRKCKKTCVVGGKIR